MVPGAKSRGLATAAAVSLQGDPAQASGLDQLLATGAHRVAIDGPRLDLGAATSFQGFVNAEDQWTVATATPPD